MPAPRKARAVRGAARGGAFLVGSCWFLFCLNRCKQLIYNHLPPPLLGFLGFFGGDGQRLGVVVDVGHGGQIFMS